MSALAFVDTETTGLDPDRHEIWNVGLVLREEGQPDYEREWFLHVDLGRADKVGLDIGGYHDRHPFGFRGKGESGVEGTYSPGRGFATEFSELTWGAHLVGAVISFDEERLRKLLRANGATPAWHYHLIDVEALAVGYLAAEKVMEPPWDSEELSQAIGVDPNQFARHTALGDAQWARAMYDRVMLR